MIRAAADLGPGFRLVLCGDGPRRARYERLNASLGSPAIMLPHSFEVGSLLGALDCFCGLWDGEGFWYAGMEAALAGVPLACVTAGLLEEIRADRAGTPWDWGPFDNAEDHRGPLWQVILPNGSSEEETVADAVWAVRQDWETALARAAVLRSVAAEYTVERMVAGWEELIWESLP